MKIINIVYMLYLSEIVYHSKYFENNFKYNPITYKMNSKYKTQPNDCPGL